MGTRPGTAGRLCSPAERAKISLGVSTELPTPHLPPRRASYKLIFIPPNLFHASAMPIVPAG